MTDTSTAPISLSTEAKHIKAESMATITFRRFLKHRMAVLGVFIMFSIVLFVTFGAFFYSEREGNTPDPTAPFVAPTFSNLYNAKPILYESEIPVLAEQIGYDQALTLLDEAVSLGIIAERDRDEVLAGTQNANRLSSENIEDQEVFNTIKIFEGLRLLRVDYGGISNPNYANDTFWVSLQRFNTDEIARIRARDPERASRDFGISDELIDARTAYLETFRALSIDQIMIELDKFAAAETRFLISQVTLESEGVYSRLANLDNEVMRGLVETSAQIGLITQAQKDEVFAGVETSVKYVEELPEGFSEEQIQVLVWLEGLRYFGVWSGNLDRFPTPANLNLSSARNNFPNLTDDQIVARSDFRKEFQDTQAHHVMNRLARVADAEAKLAASDTFISRFRHIMGTDQVGRDLLIRMIYGGQISLLIGITSVAIAITLGTLVGLIAGYFGGWIGALLMRIVEALLAIPALVLLLLLSSSLSRSTGTISFLGRELSSTVIVIVLIIGLLGWMGLSRIVRSLVLSLKEQEFVVAARTLGASNVRIIFKHILPNCIAPIVVAATLGVGGAIITEAYLSFLGFGVQEPTATWGNILNRAQGDIARYWWMWMFPGIFITLTVLSINFIGDGLRDALDPRSLR